MTSRSIDVWSGDVPNSERFGTRTGRAKKDRRQHPLANLADLGQHLSASSLPSAQIIQNAVAPLFVFPEEMCDELFTDATAHDYSENGTMPLWQPDGSKTFVVDDINK